MLMGQKIRPERGLGTIGENHRFKKQPGQVLAFFAFHISYLFSSGKFLA
jgi:hypothetical protein